MAGRPDREHEPARPLQHVPFVLQPAPACLPTLTLLLLQVWQFTLSNVSFKLNATGTGSMKKAPEVNCDKMKIICVDQSLAQ